MNEKTQKLVNLYVATLKAMRDIHQFNHWTSKGEGFYEDHLLLDRIYTSLPEEIDQSAEKFIGIFGSDVLDYSLQIDLISKIMNKYKGLVGSNLEMSLKIEEDFQSLSKSIYQLLEQSKELTLGLDDLLMSTANEREEAIYLLRQAIHN